LIVLIRILNLRDVLLSIREYWVINTLDLLLIDDMRLCPTLLLIAEIEVRIIHFGRVRHLLNLGEGLKNLLNGV
jgi:hypothetical protein